MNVKRTESPIGSKPNGPERVFLGRPMILRLISLVSIVVAVSVLVSVIRSLISEAPANAERKDKMFVTKTSLEANSVVPPIDSAAPGNLETAIFALG
jgi:hypothetical protein